MRITRQDFLETNGGGSEPLFDPFYDAPVFYVPPAVLAQPQQVDLTEAYARVDDLIAKTRAAMQNNPQFSDVPVLSLRSQLRGVRTDEQLADWWGQFLPFEAQALGQINITPSYALPLTWTPPPAPEPVYLSPAQPAHLVNTSVPLLAPLGPILPPGPIPRAIEDVPPPAPPEMGPGPVPKADYYDAPAIYSPPIYPREYDPTTGMITHSDTPIYFPPFDAPPKVTSDDLFLGVPIVNDAPPVDVGNGEGGILQTLVDALTPAGDPSAVIQATALTQPLEAGAFTPPDWEIITGPDGTTIMVQIGRDNGVEQAWNDFLAWMKRDTMITGYPNWAVAGGGGVAGWWLLGGKGRR